MYISVEDIAEIMNCMHVFSMWEQSEKLRVVICNSDARTAHLQLKRIGNHLTIKLYVQLRVKYCNNSTGEVENKSIDDYFAKSKYSAISLYEDGGKMWEGIYTNQISEDTGIIYDDFGMDGL